MKVNYAPSKRPISKWRFRAVLLLFLLPFLVFGGYLVYKISYNLLFTTAPGYLIINQITIKAPYDGTLVYIKNQGDRVVKDEIIAKIKNLIIENQYKTLLSNLKQTQLSSKQEINPEVLKISKELYENRLKTYNEILKLQQEGAATSYEVANALSLLHSAEISYLQAKQSIESSKNVNLPVPDNLKLNELKSILQSLIIKSPKSGTVAFVLTKQGELVSKGDDLITLQDDNNVTIEAFLSPNKAKYATIGKKVKAIFPNEMSIHAQIIGIKLQAQKTPPILVSPFAKENLSIVVELKPLEAIPKKLMVSYMPLKVIF